MLVYRQLWKCVREARVYAGMCRGVDFNGFWNVRTVGGSCRHADPFKGTFAIPHVQFTQSTELELLNRDPMLDSELAPSTSPILRERCWLPAFLWLFLASAPWAGSLPWSPKGGDWKLNLGGKWLSVNTIDSGGTGGDGRGKGISGLEKNVG